MIKQSICFLLTLAAFNSDANTINTETITKATLAAAANLNGNCLQFKIPTQFCIWYSPIGGRRLTPVLNHYLPDAVVTVYRNSDENPWTEVRILFDKIGSAAQSSLIKNPGGGNQSFLDEHEQHIIFKEADVVGNPALAVLQNYGGYGLLPTTATPMNPYYESMLDSTLWRGLMPEALPEETIALALDVMHHVGTGLADWGGLYPHEGSVMNNDDLKASMVIAQRAADFLSNQKTVGHFHQFISDVCGQHCKASPIAENSEETVFQMIYPVEQTDCAILGSDQSYSDKLISDDGAYAWILWRHYKGCADGDGIFVGVTP